MQLRLRYLVEDRDRHGNIRLYVRRRGQAKIRIRAKLGTPEFLKAYEAALRGVSQSVRPLPQQVRRGSFTSLSLSYFASAEFKRLDVSTQNWRKRALQRLCIDHGEKPFALLQPRHIRSLRDELSDHPGAANTRLKALKALFLWAVEADEASSNPARDVKLIRYATSGHHAWTSKEIVQFEARHPIGTKARLAFALLLFTAGRREDAVRLGPRNVIDGRLRFVQAKNEHRKPVEIDIPIHPELARILAATRTGGETFLITEFNKPYRAAGFGNKFREWCDQAALPHCSAHGLRKAAATRLAENGATTHEIMAITGHQSLEEVERYTRAAQRSRLADGAVAKLQSRAKSVPLSPPAAHQWDTQDEKLSRDNILVNPLALPRGLEPPAFAIQGAPRRLQAISVISAGNVGSPLLCGLGKTLLRARRRVGRPMIIQCVSAVGSFDHPAWALSRGRATALSSWRPQAP